MAPRGSDAALKAAENKDQECLACGGLGCSICNKDISEIKEAATQGADARDPGSPMAGMALQRGNTVSTLGTEGLAKYITGGFGEVIKEGMLEKYGTSMFAGWQKRNFHLHRVGLVYFTDKQECAKIIQFQHISNIQLVNNELHLTWEDGSTASVHRLRADTPQNTAEWEKAVKAAWGYSATE